MTDTPTPSPPPDSRSGASTPGWSVLLVEPNESLRLSLERLLSTSGLAVTAVAHPDEALPLLEERYFSVIALDPGADDDDLGWMERLRGASPGSSVVFLTREVEVQRAVALFRAGADDVVAKEPDRVEELEERLGEACRAAERRAEQQRFWTELDEFFELSLRKLMEAARQAHRHEERASGYSGRWDLKTCVLLVVDDNRDTASGLEAALGSPDIYRCVQALTGGEALDLAGRKPFHIALVKDNLPDLPGSIVARSLRDHQRDGIVLLFNDRGKEPGQVSLVEDSKSIVLIPKLVQGRQLVEQLHELRDAYVGKLREKRYLEAFRKNYYDYLAKYVELRRRLASLKPDGAQ